jgi:hypothetical protein
MAEQVLSSMSLPNYITQDSLLKMYPYNTSLRHSPTVHSISATDKNKSYQKLQCAQHRRK